MLLYNKPTNQPTPLHHSERRVQIKGSTLVTRECRASVWFVQNFLLDRFNFESFNKSFDISRFNTSVQNIVTNHIVKNNSKERSKVCLSHFTARSHCEQCLVCDKPFHKKSMHSLYGHRYLADSYLRTAD